MLLLPHAVAGQQLPLLVQAYRWATLMANSNAVAQPVTVTTIRHTGPSTYEGRTADRRFVCAHYEDGRLTVTLAEYRNDSRTGEGKSRHYHVKLQGSMQYEQLKNITAAEFTWPESETTC